MNLLSRLKYAPFVTQLVVTRCCNLSCAYCNEFDSNAQAIDVDTLKARAQKLKKLGAFSITLTGGEPLTHPSIFELIKYCRHTLKFLRTTMISNGYLLTPAIIQQLNECGLQDLQISIDGVHANDTTKKSLASLKKKLDELKQHARFNVIVSAVIGACPSDESLSVAQYAKKIGFRPRVLLIHNHNGQIQLNKEQAHVYQRIKKLTPRHLYELSDYRERLITKGEAPFKCRAGSRYLYVDEQGLVRWCSQQRDLFERDLLDYTPEDLKREFYSYKKCHAKCTLGCVRSASFFDAWRRQFHN